MLSKNTIFKSFLPPSLTTLNGVTYVVPGWHIVPEDTTLEEVQKHWEKEECLEQEQEINPIKPISETIISERTGEKYIVDFNGVDWSCTCVGYGFRRSCKHIENIKLRYQK
jgi:hypothetical protein